MNDIALNLLAYPARLLFVDDELNILKALRRLFRANNYQVFLAESGKEALELLSEQPIDLVISDMRMPEMDGASLLTEVAKRWPQITRILLTGYADLDATIVAVNQGKIYSYCSKPWVDFDLKNLVDNALEQKRLREERLQHIKVINEQNAQLKQLNDNLEAMVQQRTEQLNLSVQQLDNANIALKRQFIAMVKVFA